MISSTILNEKKVKASFKWAKIKGYVVLLGPRRMLASILATLAGLIFIEVGFSFQFLQAILTTFFLWGSASVTNMIYDLEIDKISEPDRPLPSGIISEREAYIYAGILYVGVLTLLIALNNPYVRILSMVYVVLSLIYSLPRVRGRDTVFKNILVGVAGWIPFLIPAYMFNAVDLNMLYASIAFYIWPFFASLGRDFKDYEAEVKLSAKTIPVVLGLKRAAQISFISIPVFYLILMSGYYFIIPDLILVSFLLGVMVLHMAIGYRFVSNAEDPKEGKRYGQLFVVLPATACMMIMIHKFYLAYIL